MRHAGPLLPAGAVPEVSARLRTALPALALVAALAAGGCGSGTPPPERGSGTGASTEALSAAPPRPGGRAGASETARPEGFPGTVVRVRDGDSLVVRAAGAGVEVRLDGVDAPELAQAHGAEAKRRTADLALGRTVRVVGQGRDKYERTLAEVFLPDGRSLNRELVSAGYAWWFRRHSEDRDLAERERLAREARRGLWADPDPVPPWEFRDLNPRRPRPQRRR